MKTLFYFFAFVILLGCKNTCENGFMDGDETGLDCGGKCWTCYIDPEPDRCDQTPNLYGQLYCTYPDTNGFAIQPPLDTSQIPLFFMFTYINTTASATLVLPLCNGSVVVNNYSLNGPDAFWEISKFIMEEDLSQGGYDYTYDGSTYYSIDDQCVYTPMSLSGSQCNWFVDIPPPNNLGISKVYFIDMQDSIYVVSKLNSSTIDTLTYYPIN